MGVKKDYIEKCTESIMRMDPSLNKDDVRAFIARKVKEKLNNPSIIMDNNVTGDNQNITLTEMCNWIINKKPVVSGNGTFYKQPEELTSPTSNMLREMKQGRKLVKAEMFKHMDDPIAYARGDLKQGNLKVIMNAEYGGSGAPTAAFYTKYSPAATTLMAQSIITTMAAFFEGFVGDRQVFFNVNECFDWMNLIIEKKSTKEIHKWIMVPTAAETFNRIRKHFYVFDIASNTALNDYINHCSDTELTYLYYANNLKEFVFNHKKISTLIHDVLAKLPLYEASEDNVPENFNGKFDNIKKYNDWVAHEMFLNPYVVPEIIKSEIEKLQELVKEYCFVEYLTPDSIVKLNNHKRNTVLLVDTDSNIINAGIFGDFIQDELFIGDTFGRTRLYNDMICVSILASFISPCVANMLDYYGRMHNMGKEARAELTMKNEFMFRIFFLLMKKKRYVASMVLREGHIMIPFKHEIKGVDFIKAGVTDEVTNRFTKILEDNILFSDKLRLHQMNNELKQFEKEIYQDLKNGGVKYLKPQMYKSEGAYKSKFDKSVGRVVNGAWKLQVFRAATVWNEIYPEDKIYSLDRVKVIKLIVTKPEDLDVIKKDFPKEYKMVIDKVFNSSNPEISKAGLKVIGLPSVKKTVPEWIVRLIDYDVTISDVISSFRSILNALRIEGINVKTPNGKANVVSSLISI